MCLAKLYVSQRKLLKGGLGRFNLEQNELRNASNTEAMRANTFLQRNYHREVPHCIITRVDTMEGTVALHARRVDLHYYMTH